MHVLLFALDLDECYHVQTLRGRDKTEVKITEFKKVGCRPPKKLLMPREEGMGEDVEIGKIAIGWLGQNH